MSLISLFFIFIVSLFICYDLSKLNLTTLRNSPANEVVVGLLSFLIVRTLDTINMVLLFFQFKLKIAVHTACTTRKLLTWTTFDTFFVFSRRVSFPYKCRKAILWWSRKLISQKFPLLWTMVTHRDTDFSKLVHLCLVKTFFPYSTPGIISWKGASIFCSKPKFGQIGPKNQILSDLLTKLHTSQFEGSKCKFGINF